MRNEFRPLFKNDALDGWKVVPRWIALYEEGSERWKDAWNHKGIWTIENGVIEGRQDPPGSGYGSYLVSDETFQDFELKCEARPDWPADTGIYVRASADGSVGYQVLLDHRKSGNIGGFYGNSIGGFHAVNWNVDAEYDQNGNAAAIKIEDPADTLEPIGQEKPTLLDYKISGQEFLKIWKWNDWNELRIVCQGKLPEITTYINGEKIASINTEKLPSEKFFREKALEECKGHIAFEVHDNDPRMGEARWGKNAACRWRNVCIREL